MKEIEEFFKNSAYLIGAIGALLAAIAALFPSKREEADKELSSQLPQGEIKKNEEFGVTSSKPLQQKRNTLRIVTFIIGIFMVLLAVGFLIIGPVSSSLKSVEITNPRAGQKIEVSLADTGSGSFTVSGTSAEVFTASDLRVYVLVHPAAPFADGWWIQQPATVDKTGEWTMLAWIGSPEFPPHVGDKIEILVVAANPNSVSNRDWISDPKDVKPVAQSNIICISIGSIRK